MSEGMVKLIKLTNGELIIGTVKTEEHDNLVSSFRNTNDFLRMNIYISSPAVIIEEDEDSLNVYPWIYSKDVISDNWILLNTLNVVCITEPIKEIYDMYVKYLSGAVTEPIM